MLARLVPLAPADPYALALAAAQSLLATTGAAYDGLFTAENRSARAGEAAAYVSGMTDWRAEVAPLYAKIDRMARELERGQLDAGAGATLTPRLASVSGRTVPLAPEVGAALTFPAGYDDEAGAPATLVLSTSGGSPAPILRLAAREAGRGGNRLEVRVVDVVGFADRFVVEARLGGYVETWAPLDATAPWSPDATAPASLLLAPPTQVGLGRPATIDWTPLAGGAGRVLESAEQRAADALAFPATGAAERQALEIARRALRGSWARKPAPPSVRYGTVSVRLARPEADVMDAVAQTIELFALLDALAASP